VTASVRASAARSASVKYGASRQAATAVNYLALVDSDIWSGDPELAHADRGDVSNPPSRNPFNFRIAYLFFLATCHVVSAPKFEIGNP
jgi:hypothetical protein